MSKAPTNTAETGSDLDPIFRSLATNLPNYYFCKDREGRFLFANALFCESLGKPLEEVVGKTDSDLFPPYLADKYQHDDSWVLETGKFLETIEENVVGRELKRKRWVQTIKTPIRDREGQIIGTQALYWDVTPQKLQQSVTRVLADSASLGEAMIEVLRAICESMGWEFGSLWIAQRDAQVLRCVETWHPSAVPLVELQDFNARSAFRRGEGIVGRVWADREPLWIPDILDWVPAVVPLSHFPQAPLVSGAGLRGAVGFPILLRGEVLGVLEFFSRDTLRLRDPEPGGDLLPVMVGLGGQIGQFIERRRAEEDRDLHLKLIQAIIDNSPDAIYVKDSEGRYLFANQWYEKTLHCDRRLIKGKTDHELFPSRLADNFRENDRQVLREGEPSEFEETVPHDDGDHVYSSKKYPLLDDAGVPYAVCGISTDITEHKLAEAAKLHDLSHLLDELPTVLKRISRLGEGLPPEHIDRLEDSLGKVNVLVGQARAVTRTTLTYAHRYPNGGPSLPPLSDCGAEVRRWLRVVPGLLPDDVIEAQVRDRLAEGEPFLADPNAVLYVLRNLWTNARKAFKDARRASYRIVLDLVIEGPEWATLDGVDVSYIVLRVADNGDGIRAEITDRIFRGRIEGGGGHGLGSQIIRWVMDNHLGLIRFATAGGVGTLIEVWFPRLSPPLTSQSIVGQRERYGAIRERAGPIRRISEDDLLSILDH